MSSKQKLSVIEGAAEPALVDWTFNHILQNQCQKNPNNVAVYSQQQNHAITYGQLQTMSEQLAKGLYRIGIRRGDRVGVLLGNRSEYAVIMFACSKLGAYFTLFNYAYTTTELINALNATRPKVLLTTSTSSKYTYEPIFDKLYEALPDLSRIVLLEDISRPGEVNASKSDLYMGYNDLMKLGIGSEISLDQLEENVDQSDILNLQFTSGSTGLPKAAALTHHGMANSARYIGVKMKIDASDSIIIPVPLFHAFGLIIGLCTSVVYGASIVLPSEYHDTAATLSSIERYKCTGLFGVTTMFVDMLAHADFATTRRSSLRFGLMAGSAMPHGLLTRVIEGFPIRDVYTNWGMTELSSIVTMTEASDPIEKKLRSAGQILPNFTGKIVDPNTAEILPWGKRGEIVICGFGVMHSYYGQPDQTARAVRQHREDSNDRKHRRWMHTGDEGYLDSEGYFVITGRIKDLIIRGGENISPIEIESRLYQHPSIKQCAVFAVPSQRYGEEVAAMLEVVDLSTRPSDAEIRSWVRQDLARYKVPSYIWWLGDKAAGVPDDWPKTANGKLRKDDIRQIAKGLLNRDGGHAKEYRASL